ncbi:MAG: hypothetical protein AAGA91_13925 [Pseudomonadota bacterium]
MSPSRDANVFRRYPRRERLGTKWLALVVYIGFGMLMLRWGTTPMRRAAGLIGGAMTHLYVLGAAHTRSIGSFLTALGQPM